MEIMELARTLGEAIKQSEQMMCANRAEAAYDADPGLRAAIDEYNSLDEALSTTDDDAFVAKIRERMDAIYDEVTANPIYTEYVRTQNEVHALMEEVNGEINFVVTGKRGCGHDGCDGCDGCH